MQSLLNIGQAADLLGLKVKTIYTYVCQRRIPFVKLGARVLFEPDKLEKWVHNNAFEPLATSSHSRGLSEE